MSRRKGLYSRLVCPRQRPGCRPQIDDRFGEDGRRQPQAIAGVSEPFQFDPSHARRRRALMALTRTGRCAMNDHAVTRPVGQARALWMSTIAFTICFAVWTIFSIIGVQIKTNLGLNATEFGLLVGTPILSGSLIRLALGIWTDQYGGRRVYTIVMLAAAVATYCLTWAKTYPEFLVAAFFVGIAGGSFAVGVAYVSRFYAASRQGTALGIFGAGNVGAAVTKFLAPFVLVAYGWQAVAQIWALAIGVMGIVFWIFSEEDPV